MTPIGLLVVTSSLLAGSALWALAASLLRHLGKPGANWFAATLFAQGFWCLTYGAGLLVATPGWRYALEIASWVGLGWLGYLFLGFALEYTGHGDLRRSRFFTALAVFPLLNTALVVTSPVHDLLWSDAALVTVFGLVAMDYTVHTLTYVLVLAAIVKVGIGVVLLVDTIFSYGPLYRNEALAVAVSTVPPALGIVVWLADPGTVGALNWGVVLSLPHVCLDAYAFVGKNMFDSNPTTRRVADRQAIHAVPDPVVVLDGGNRVVDANDAARSVFDGFDGAATFGEPAATVLPDGAADPAADAARYVAVRADAGRREFRRRCSPLTEPGGAVVGHLLLFQDVTDEREREQRLTVLNRVLRHNLRNRLTVVTGGATHIADRAGDPELVDAAERIARSGRELEAVGEKAREFDRVRRTAPAVESVALDAVLEDAVDGVAATHPDAVVDCRIETDAAPRTDGDLLALALENLIENAVEHSSTSPPSHAPEDAVEYGSTSPDSPTARRDAPGASSGEPSVAEAPEDAVEHSSTSPPSHAREDARSDAGERSPDVWVSVADATDDAHSVVVTVEDENGGIPEAELAAIQEGSEGDLEHGTGIGLWIVEWSLRLLGADLTFENTDRGTLVRVALPADPETRERRTATDDPDAADR